jgi:hypothetical protein
MFAFIIGLALGGAGGFYVAKHLAGGGSADSVSIPQLEKSASQTDDMIKDKLKEWNITQDDLNRAGEVIKREGQKLGTQIKDATADARIIGMLKFKYAFDGKLSAKTIVVESRDGHVTLTGSVNSPDFVGRAVVIALETDGVVDVASKLQIR